MKKYKWSLYKTIEFLNNRRPDLEIRASFIRQLSYYEKRLLQETGVQSDAWTELASKPHLENDELILTHTFLNAQMGPFADFTRIASTEELNPNSKLKWIDERESKKDLLVTNESKDDLINKESVQKVTSHYDKQAEKSIIKVTAENTFLNDRIDTEEGDLSDQKPLRTTEKEDNKSDIKEQSQAESEEKHSKSVDLTTQNKAFDYKSKNISDIKPKQESDQPDSSSKNSKHKANNSVDKTKKDSEVKTLNYKGKKSREATPKEPLKPPSTISKVYEEIPNRARPYIKKDSIKLKNKPRAASGKRPKSKETKKRRRPRSNDDRKLKNSSIVGSVPGKRTGSRGASEKSNKEFPTNDTIKRRSIVNKFVNNTILYQEQQSKIDSRNIYKNSYKNNPNWNSASLNLKKYVKKDLTLRQPTKKKTKNNKSQASKCKATTSGIVPSVDKQLRTFINHDPKMLVNSYFPNDSDFSKSFGSSLYNPTNTSIPSGKKLAALKNNLIMNNTYTRKSTGSSVTKSKKYQTLKTIMKPQAKPEVVPKKRSMSPGTKVNLKFSASHAIKLAQNKPRAGSKKKTMRSPGIIGKF